MRGLTVDPGQPGRRGLREPADRPGAVGRAGGAGLRPARLRRADRADGHGVRPVQPAEVRRVAAAVRASRERAPAGGRSTRASLARAATPPADESLPPRARRLSCRRSGCSTRPTGRSAKRCWPTRRAETTRWARWGPKNTSCSMDRYCGFVYHELIADLLCQAEADDEGRLGESRGSRGLSRATPSRSCDRTRCTSRTQRARMPDTKTLSL